MNSQRLKPNNRVKELNNSTYIMMHTKEENQVVDSNFERIINNAPQGVETFVRDNNNHFFVTDFINPQNDTEYCERINDFINRVIESGARN